MPPHERLSNENSLLYHNWDLRLAEGGHRFEVEERLRKLATRVNGGGHALHGRYVDCTSKLHSWPRFPLAKRAWLAPLGNAGEGVPQATRFDVVLQLCQGAELPSEMSLEDPDSLYRLLFGNRNRRIPSEEVPDELNVSHRTECKASAPLRLSVQVPMSSDLGTHAENPRFTFLVLEL